MTVMACQAGKDVYVEKPTSVAIGEGRRMVEAARKYSRIVQVGTQQRSATHFQKAVELVRSGRLGQISMVRCWNVGNTAPEGIGNPPDSDPPADLDWDFWLGPAPKVPFNPNRFGVFPDVWSYFRYFWDYAGGMMTDWGVHLIDIVQWAMNVDAPQSVSTAGGKFALTDNRDTPDTILATYRYPGFIMTYENRSANGRQINAHGYGIEFYGTNGTLFVDRSGYDLAPEQQRRTGGGTEDRIGRDAGVHSGQSHARPQFHRLHQVSAATDLRHRDRPSLFERRDSGQFVVSIWRARDVGRRRRAHYRKRPRSGPSQSRVPEALDADCLRRRGPSRTGRMTPPPQVRRLSSLGCGAGSFDLSSLGCGAGVIQPVLV